MFDDLKKIREEALKEIQDISSIEGFNELRIKYFGKKRSIHFCYERNREYCS